MLFAYTPFSRLQSRSLLAGCGSWSNWGVLSGASTGFAMDPRLSRDWRRPPPPGSIAAMSSADTKTYPGAVVASVPWFFHRTVRSDFTATYFRIPATRMH